MSDRWAIDKIKWPNGSIGARAIESHTRLGTSVRIKPIAVVPAAEYAGLLAAVEELKRAADPQKMMALKLELPDMVWQDAIKPILIALDRFNSPEEKP